MESRWSLIPEVATRHTPLFRSTLREGVFGKLPNFCRKGQDDEKEYFHSIDNIVYVRPCRRGVNQCLRW